MPSPGLRRAYQLELASPARARLPADGRQDRRWSPQRHGRTSRQRLRAAVVLRPYPEVHQDRARERTPLPNTRAYSPTPLLRAGPKPSSSSPRSCAGSCLDGRLESALDVVDGPRLHRRTHAGALTRHTRLRPSQADTSTNSAGLNDRSLGWLRFIWDKATTEDDWSDQGEPHPWWDRYSEPPFCAFPRFDLAEMGYVLPMMLEATPAWREGYTRILDELARRYVTFWGGIDWNTLIGPDPNVDKYPPEWLTVVPEHLRGRYSLPGWTGNGIEPWGLQPDPVGCDGNLFYRGWLNLLLSMRHYVSGRGDTDHAVRGFWLPEPQIHLDTSADRPVHLRSADSATAGRALREHQDLAVLYERGRSGAQALRLADAHLGQRTVPGVDRVRQEALHGPRPARPHRLGGVFLRPDRERDDDLPGTGERLQCDLPAALPLSAGPPTRHRPV